ncbi:MAG: hypothetical protein F6K54_11375 [Okeania sp. SIO3B5]|uniref:hypothetical protein n=1 Tax=Okeania sp. SIO3B5 TaxID=2607811 RepID=UPI00140068EE|nr:hypothetical protein [Okeania sp. SIO3B5]NEO53627.1 hypothetical protein [Okeania sp. SIO3B5]
MSKDFEESSPEAMAEFFSFCEAPINICLWFSTFFHLFLSFPVKNHQHFHFVKLRKNEQCQRIFRNLPQKQCQNIFIPRSTNKDMLVVLKIFPSIPFLPSEKSPTFSFSEAPKKNSRVKGFLVAS